MTPTDTPFDSLERRAPALREAKLFAALRGLLAAAKDRAAGLAAQLGTIAPETIDSRAALARLPVVRKSDLKAMQQAAPPFAGLAAAPLAAMRRVLVSPGPLYEPEGRAIDWWGTARALHAAGFRRGDLVLNCFSYHLTPGGHIMESGAQALGCPVLPAGPGNTDLTVEASAVLRPAGYVGTPDFLKILLDRGRANGADLSCLRQALVSGAAFPPSLQQEIAGQGIAAYQAYASAELGVIAYETPARAGLVVNEGLIVEILRPGTGDPVPEGEIGEVVVTRLDPDYPLLRLATGDLSRLLPGVSSCGRTAPRLAGWLGRADQTTKIKGMFVTPGQVAEIARRHPELQILRLEVTRADEQDMATLRAETTAPADPALAARIGETLRAVARIGGIVVLAPPGSLPRDGKVIADLRPA
jgi:phenylacetate-CoA ligase